MSGRFCVTITECKTNEDKATLGFVVANAAIGSDKETMVFLSADGIWAAVRGELERIDVGAPFAPLAELVGKFVANGGKILVCSPCMKKRAVTEEMLVPGASPAGGAMLVEWLSQDPSCVGY